MNALLLPPVAFDMLPSAEHREMAERVAAQPRPQLSDAEVDAWAEALAEGVADAED